MATTDLDLPEYVKKHDLRRRIQEIAEAGLGGRLLLLIGAGFSKDARKYPLGAELAATLLREAYAGFSDAEITSVASKYELAAIAQQFCETTTEKRPQLVATIKRELTRPQKSRSEAENRLARLASACRLDRIFTTNFDFVIEEALGHRARIVEPSITDIRAFADEVRQTDITGIFHLNGDIKNPVVTETEIRKHRGLFYELLRQDLLTHVLVMIGYSFRDDAITHIYDELFDLLQTVGQDRRNYIVMPVDGPAEYEIAERLWRSRGDIVLLPLHAGKFLEMLTEELDDCRYEQSIQAIAARTSDDPEELRARLREHQDKLKHVTPGELLEAIEQVVKMRSI